VVPPASRPITRVGRYSGTPLRLASGVAYRALTVSGAPFQGTSAAFACRVRGSYNPAAPEGSTVWAVPGSLAATSGISVDFSSSGYLDVSVPRVRSSCEVTGLAPRRVSPFGHPRITACVPLPLAYRSLPRPSSPPCAQASPTCFRSLDYKILASSRARAIYELKSANCKSRRFKSHDHSIPTVVKQLRCLNNQIRDRDVSRRATSVWTFSTTLASHAYSSLR
jgi:hypothetical protein